MAFRTVMHLTSGKLWVLLLSLVVSLPALAGHPSLFYDAAQIPTLRTQAQGTHQGIYQPLYNGSTYFLGSTINSSALATWPATGKTFDLGDRRDIGSSLIVFAFTSQLTTDSRYFALAKGWLLTVASWGNLDLDGTHDLLQAHLLAGLAVAYDMLASQLTSTEAAQVRATIASNANALMNTSKSGEWWAREYMQNHNWVNHAAIGLAALATQGELPATTTQPWLDLATSNAQKVKTVLDGASDGTWHEGFGYAYYGLSWHLPFVTALRRLTGVDLGDLGMVRGHAQALGHVQLPERPSNYLLANGDFFSFSKDQGLMPLRYAAARYRDGVAQAVADTWISGTSASGYAPELNHRVFEFLYYDPSVASVDLHAQPLDWYGADLQAAVFRSSWDPGALVFALKSGPYGGTNAWKWQTTGVAPTGGLNIGHDHADDNGFYLYGSGSWLAPEAEGYYIGHADSPGPAANKTVFHNALTIDGVGQLGEGVRTSGDEAMAYSWFGTRKGSVPFFGSTQHFGYAVADGASLYPSALGVTRWDRHALFLDRKWVVLRDIVKANASHTYGWDCHFMNGVTQEGTWLHGIGQSGQSLGVAVVAPASFNVTTAAQQPVNVGNFNPSGAVYLAEVKPATPSPNATFLAALVPTAEASWASRPNVTPIDPALPDAGVRFREGTTTITLAVFNDAPTQVRKVGSFTLSGQTAVVKYVNGIATRVLLVRGISFADAANTLVSQATPTGTLEVDGLNATTLAISGDKVGQPRVYAPSATRVLWNGASVSFVRDGAFVVVASGTGGSGDSSYGGSTDGTDGTTPGGTSGGTSDGTSGGDVGTGGSPQPETPGVQDSGDEAEVPKAMSCSAYGRQVTALWIGVCLAEFVRQRRRRRTFAER